MQTLNTEFKIVLNLARDLGSLDLISFYRLFPVAKAENRKAFVIYHYQRIGDRQQIYILSSEVMIVKLNL